MAIIFSSTNTTRDSGWGGYSVRHVVSLAALTAPGFNVGNIRVTLTLDTGSTGTLDAAWIGGGIASPAYDFDGSQVQLLFAGSPSPAVGVGDTVSDFVPFTFDFIAGTAIVVSTHWTGSLASLDNNATSACGGAYQLQAAGTEGQSAPGGTWTAYSTSSVYFLTQMEFTAPSADPANPFSAIWIQR